MKKSKCKEKNVYGKRKICVNKENIEVVKKYIELHNIKKD